MTEGAAKPSYRRAINAKCKDCSYDPLAGGTWRAQVAACGVPSCALYGLRPLPEGIKHSWQT